MAVHHRGIVMPWECDDMGHLNIRFHAARYGQAQGHFASVGTHPHRWTERIADRFVFFKEARVGARLTCSLDVPPCLTAAPAISGCLWDMSTGDILTRIETRLGLAAAQTSRAPSDALSWTNEAMDREWTSAMGMFTPPVDCRFGMAERITGVVSDANALAVLELSGGSDYRMTDSPIGFVVAEMNIVYGAAVTGDAAAFSTKTALLGHSRRSLTFQHRIVTPREATEIAVVRSICVFFDRRSRQAAPIPFDIRNAPLGVVSSR